MQDPSLDASVILRSGLLGLTFFVFVLCACFMSIFGCATFTRYCLIAEADGTLPCFMYQQNTKWLWHAPASFSLCIVSFPFARSVAADWKAVCGWAFCCFVLCTSGSSGGCLPAFSLPFLVCLSAVHSVPLCHVQRGTVLHPDLW